MKRTTELLSEHIHEIEVDGARYLGIHVSDSSNSRSGKQLIEEGPQAGHVVSGQQVSDWTLAGLTEIDGRVFLYGPHHEGRTVETVLEQEPDSGLKYVLRLANAFALLESRSIEAPPMQTNGLLFLDDGGTLVLPPKILERLRSVQIEENRRETFEKYNHPELSGGRGHAFSIGVLLYKIATGEFPFEGDDDVELHTRMRGIRLLPPDLKNTSVSSGFSATIMRALDAADETCTAETLRDELLTHEREGFFQTVSDKEDRQRTEEGERLRSRYEKTYRRRRFFQKNGRGLGFASVAAVAVGYFAISMIVNATKPRATEGLAPLEVVELFYESINTLDHAAMEDTVDRGIAKPQINEATNVFVMSRVRLGNEGSTGMVDPDIWVEAGRPALDPTNAVYGIRALTITELSPTRSAQPIDADYPEELRFAATYERWYPVDEETMANRISGANATVRRMEDSISMQYDGRYWVITSMDSDRSDILTPQEFDASLE